MDKEGSIIKISAKKNFEINTFKENNICSAFKAVIFLLKYRQGYEFPV